MPLHVNGKKDVWSLRLVIGTLCVAALGLTCAISYQSIMDGPIAQSLALLAGAVFGALCAILGLSHRQIMRPLIGVDDQADGVEEKRHERHGHGAPRAPSEPGAPPVSRSRAGPVSSSD